ncbi:MAG TPA: 2Fe-2S iron-sulfur cluster-binding protein [Armatimonadota bacterium]|jgi:formate dehydrogenase major subunit
MAKVSIKLNGQRVEAQAGSTVLQAAKAAGVDIPTLCHHPALKDIGACRMCVVEVTGQREVQPACTFPISEGMEVTTETPKVNALRKFVLEMLFSERNHYCMFCEMSGDCELQSMAYRFGLDHWTYPSTYGPMPVDASRKHFMMDHARCILCRRCIRACEDLVANHTLGLKARGAKTFVCADMDVPFGDSTCVSCGTCLQVCPTGALVDRRSAFGGREKDVALTSTACTFCSVGCEAEVVTRAHRVLRVEGDWEGANSGLLCVAGRFESLEDGRPRVSSPMVRRGANLVPTTWDEALDQVATKLKAAPESVSAYVTANALNETLDSFTELFQEQVGASVSQLEPSTKRLGLPSEQGLGVIDRADAILVAGVDLDSNHRVVGYAIKRAREEGAELRVYCPSLNGCKPFGPKKSVIRDLKAGIELCQGAQQPVVVYGLGLTPDEASQLAVLRGKASFVALAPAANEAHAASMGLASGSTNHARVAYLLLSDQPQDPLTASLAGECEFVVAHAAYEGHVTEKADVVLPAPLWYEREGTFTALGGRLAQVRPALSPPPGILPEPEVLSRLADRL